MLRYVSAGDLNKCTGIARLNATDDEYQYFEAPFTA